MNFREKTLHAIKVSEESRRVQAADRLERKKQAAFAEASTMAIRFREQFGVTPEYTVLVCNSYSDDVLPVVCVPDTESEYVTLDASGWRVIANRNGTNFCVDPDLDPLNSLEDFGKFYFVN